MSGRDDVAKGLEAVVRIHHQLRGAHDVGTLFLRASESACVECGFDRGVVLSVHDGHLTATETSALPTAASDRLRRMVLAKPIALEAGTEEHTAVRRAGGGKRGRAPKGSVLATALELGEFALVAVAPEGVTLAVLLLDRAEGPVDAADLALAGAAAAVLASELARVVQRTRVGELVAELRGFSTMAQALAGEVLEAPAALPRDRGHGATFSQLDTGSVSTGEAVEALFTERERRVAALLVDGRSNREIAEVLVLSPETVKTHVARILRKLGASNRVEAVSLYLKLAGG